MAVATIMIAETITSVFTITITIASMITTAIMIAIVIMTTETEDGPAMRDEEKR